MPEDEADRHVERWHDHWIDIDFEPGVEAAAYRVWQIDHYIREAKRSAAEEVGLHVHEYETLHALMIRDTPGHATPGELAEETRVSPAGITGRLDSMERAGYLRRVPSSSDRRRVDVQIASAGEAIWRRAMDLRGRAEDDLFAVLDPRELVTLNRLLKKLTLPLDTGA